MTSAITIGDGRTPFRPLIFQERAAYVPFSDKIKTCDPQIRMDATGP
ncbi:MAG: hypothetical protein JXR37_17770 [Kiritimatiellae bacterium]|nr:hypothetical protein [Kiritimatiellia bacterium]